MAAYPNGVTLGNASPTLAGPPSHTTLWNALTAAVQGIVDHWGDDPNDRLIAAETEIASLQSSITSLQADIVTLQANIDAEATTRFDADQALAGQIAGYHP